MSGAGSRVDFICLLHLFGSYVTSELARRHRRKKKPSTLENRKTTQNDEMMTFLTKQARKTKSSKQQQRTREILIAVTPCVNAPGLNSHCLSATAKKNTHFLSRRTRSAALCGNPLSISFDRLPNFSHSGPLSR